MGQPKQNQSTSPANTKNKNKASVTFSKTSTSFNEDGVSVITPVTGIPPDSPDRLCNLPSLMRPSPRSRSLESNALYSPPRTVPGRSKNAEGEGDDFSVMTPSSPVRTTRN